MKKFFILIIGFLLISTSGCGYKTISHGTEITQSEVTKIQPGKTKKSEIFLNFGEPTKTADEEKVFFYSWTRGTKAHFLGIGSGDAEANSLVIIFDEDDIVEAYRVTRGAVDSGQVD
jgi:outer membrane protein assembly factor BamE (lipoprotein component of BamABCDE complex)